MNWQRVKKFAGKCLLAASICCGILTAGPAVPCGIAAEKGEAATAEDIAAVRAIESARVQVVQQAMRSVVCIYGKERAGGGSGVLISRDGLAVTNDHVVSAAGYEGLAGLSDGGLYRWRLIGTDPGGDVAIIQLMDRPEGGFKTASLGDSNRVAVGDWVMAMGNPFALADDQRASVSLGIVSGVKRFQAGQGMNRLVYGNCFQVDAAINPGNSGGPLFSLHGEVIGINGRCSFDERGRVNVGLGYAISANQVRMFVPELMATKVAQHGTLDVVFASRNDGVVCESMNVESPLAKQGLQLGDRITAFEGVKVESANQLTSLLSTYPANWPARVDYESGGEARTAFVRLLALPYEKNVKEAPPAAKPGANAKIQMDLSRAGTIRDVAINEEMAGVLWDRSRSEKKLGEGECIVVDAKSSSGSAVTMVLAANGRWGVRWEVGEEGAVVLTFDGKRYWRQRGNEKEQEVSAGKGLREPLGMFAMAMSASVTGKFSGEFGKMRLEGADQAKRTANGAGSVCARLATEETSGEKLYLWLENVEAWESPKLVKLAVGIENDEPVPSVLFREGKLVESEGEVASEAIALRIPQSWELVTGLREKVLQSFQVMHAKVQRGDKAQLEWAAKFLSDEGGKRE
ncbi:MAG: trypsin-like peptidase domain-containing protein [Pirellulales bacterium]